MLKTLEWLKGLELATGGIAAGPGQAAYPEVSGYLIPTFYDYGETEIAGRVAEWLLEIQEEAPQTQSGFKGSFRGLDGKVRTFDTAACMEGLGRAFQETQDARYQEAAVKAWEWLEGEVLPSGAMRVSPKSDKTHPYTMRASWLIGDDRAAKYWKNEAWGIIRTHYAAYALEGLWGMGEKGFVEANLLLARKAFVPVEEQSWNAPKSGPGVTGAVLMPFTAGSSWRTCEGTDACATAQMAMLYHQAGMEEDAKRLAAGVERMVQDDGGVRLGLEHAECNSWTAKWYLDMWKILNHRDTENTEKNN